MAYNTNRLLTVGHAKIIHANTQNQIDNLKSATEYGIRAGATWESQVVAPMESGGMYSATGIEYDSTTRSRSSFIRVKPNETLYVIVDESLSQTMTVYEFASNAKSATGVNERLTSQNLPNGTVKKCTVGASTNFIRLSYAYTGIENTYGRIWVARAVTDVYTTTLTLSASDFAQGGCYEFDGSVSLTIFKKRIHTRRFHVLPGATITFTPGTIAAHLTVLYKRVATAGYYGAFDPNNTAGSFIVPYEGEIIVQLKQQDDTLEIAPSDYDATITIATNIARRGERVYNTLMDALKDEQLSNGAVFRTLGIREVSDNGGATYRVTKKLVDSFVDNCSTFACADAGLCATRVFNEESVTLESLNFGVATWQTCWTVLRANAIRKVSCNVIATDQTIVLGVGTDWGSTGLERFDFTFREINYTGTGYALKIDSVENYQIRGGRIVAENGSGMMVTNTVARCGNNIIEINDIQALTYGLAIRPVGGRGVGNNFINIENIVASVIGISTYIPNGTGKYSWEGEDKFSVGNIKCTNVDGTGVGVAFEIEPDTATGMNKDGTITGITYLNLSVEGSDNGIKMRCGVFDPSRQDACIKAISINNMRVRENLSIAGKFLIGDGYIRDVYIKPTSPIRPDQWLLNTSTGEAPARIDAPITPYYAVDVVGYGLNLANRLAYVNKPKHGACTLYKNIDFHNLMVPDAERDPDTWSSKVFFASAYFVDESLAGTTVNLDLALHYRESADCIRFKLPAAANGNDTVLNVTYMRPHKTITLTNDTNAEKEFLIYCNQIGETFGSDFCFAVRELDAPISSEIVPYNYDEDNI